jgi:hypothetical protein
MATKLERDDVYIFWIPCPDDIRPAICAYAGTEKAARKACGYGIWGGRLTTSYLGLNRCAWADSAAEAALANPRKVVWKPCDTQDPFKLAYP